MTSTVAQRAGQLLAERRRDRIEQVRVVDEQHDGYRRCDCHLRAERGARLDGRAIYIDGDETGERPQRNLFPVGSLAETRSEAKPIASAAVATSEANRVLPTPAAPVMTSP